MTVKRADGTIVMQESEPLTIASGKTSQKLAASADEYFYGGGTQNGRFSHKGQVIKIAIDNTWVDGSVSSPNPFYWSTKGYGVLRNTFKTGAYDFQNSNSEEVIASHDEKEFDAYYFISDANDNAKKQKNCLRIIIKLPEMLFYYRNMLST